MLIKISLKNNHKIYGKMKSYLNKNHFVSLTKRELKSLNGGQPDEDTGFWYDAFYVMTVSILINPRPTSWATAVRKY